MPSEKIEEISHPWKARFIVGLIMVLLGFFGLVFTNIEQTGAWYYWRGLCVINGILCIWLNWDTRRKKKIITFPFLWREILHWLGLFLAVYFVSKLVDIGILSRFLASLQVVSLLALATYLSGVYSDPFLMVIGVVLGVFAACAALFEQYLYSIMLPLTFVAVGIIFVIVKIKEKRTTS